MNRLYHFWCTEVHTYFRRRLPLSAVTGRAPQNYIRRTTGLGITCDIAIFRSSFAWSFAGYIFPVFLRSCTLMTLMASTALEIAATRSTPFRTGASEVQFACCARFSSHRFPPTTLGTWASLFFMERWAIHRIFHVKIVTRQLAHCKHRT